MMPPSASTGESPPGKNCSPLPTRNMRLCSLDRHLRCSYIRPTNREPSNTAGDEKDAEDWSMTRDGAGYPMSLMAPYPANYNGTPVFETSTGSSASWSAPVLQLVFALVAMTVMLW